MTLGNSHGINERMGGPSDLCRVPTAGMRLYDWGDRTKREITRVLTCTPDHEKLTRKGYVLCGTTTARCDIGDLTRTRLYLSRTVISPPTLVRKFSTPTSPLAMDISELKKIEREAARQKVIQNVKDNLPTLISIAETFCPDSNSRDLYALRVH